MAGSGFFLGGLAEGMETARKGALAERTQTETTGIAHRGLAIKEATEARAAEQQMLDQGNKIFSDWMEQINTAVKSAVATGTPPEVLMPQIEPLVAKAEQFGARIGRGGSVRPMIQAMFSQPSTIKAAEIAAKAKAHGTVTEQTAIAGAEKGIPITSGPAPAGPTGAPVVEKFDATKSHYPFGDMDKKVAHSEKLGDNFRQATKTFDTIEDFYQRIKASETENTGAADIAAVFSYIKMLDATSTVSPGEQKSVKEAASIIQQLELQRDRILAGKSNTLHTDTKKDLIRMTEKIYAVAKKSKDRITEEHAHIGRKVKINPSSYIPGYTGPSTDFPMTTPSGIGFRVSQ